MFRKIMKHLTNNLGLKILSVLFAVALWLVVVNFDDPSITRSYRVPVTVTNQRILEDMGKVYEVVNQSNIAVFSVTGKRSYMDQISSSNFKATADLSQADFNQEGDTKLVPIDVTADKWENQFSITKQTNNMQITIEDFSDKQFYITTVTEGTPDAEYAIGEYKSEPNMIKVSGPQSIVSQVSKVVASINVEGINTDVTDSVVPILYDEAGNVIDKERLNLSVNAVLVSVKMLGTKTVPINCQVSGTPADGYRYTRLEYAPESIKIKGEPSLLNDIVEIPIPADDINLEGATDDVENDIDITPYLPEGISLVDQEATKVAVKAVVEKLDTKTLELPTKDIKVENLDEKYEVDYIGTSVQVSVRGLKSDIGELTAEQLKAVIDVNGLLPGIQNIDVTVTVDEKYEIMGTITARIQIQDKKADTGDGIISGDNSGGTGDNGSGGAENGSGNSGTDEKKDGSDSKDPENSGDKNDAGKDENTGKNEEKNDVEDTMTTPGGGSEDSGDTKEKTQN